ncbi:putative methyltransferase-domain-containing protein [Talaromyces proteolyticus]|uniref:Methyltransferase-domain-containing protein n=1 Tax=Talaromyces proteolyticus TaxID=1131652 RepID=A0AAD4KIS5_9EURO|nr:putative methyltransferase-domain-containing protein [Talaromyces proteolyticus]KAH8692401.1 putative methyltransferase-domain-containing protein [Talaromyces proteolyticus]
MASIYRLGDDGVALLVAQCYQLVDLKDLDIPPSSILKSPSVQTYIYNELFNEGVLSPIIPPETYRLRVLKALISRIEASEDWDPEEDEIIEPLITALTILMSLPKEDSSGIDSPPLLSFVKYTLPSSTRSQTTKSIATSESRGLIYGFGSTGFRTWEAALHLGTYLSCTEDGRALIQGKRVLELGAGTGFVSLLCKRHLGAKSVLMTDGNAKLVDLFNSTCLKENKLADDQDIQGEVWEWGTALAQEDGSDASVERFDVALGADLTYDTSIIPLLTDTVSTLFSSHGVKKFVLSATIRNEETFNAFLAACRDHDFRISKIQYESPSFADQTGFFHDTRTPIWTYTIEPS